MGPKIKNGLLYAASSILIHILFYLIKPELNANIGIGLIISFLLPIFFIRKGILEDRTLNEGLISFGEAFVTGAAVLFIGIVISTVIIGLFINFMPGDYKEFLTEATLTASQNFSNSLLGMFGMSAEQIAEANEQSNSMNIDPFSAPMMGLGILSNLFFPGSVIVLITAAILKKG